MDLLTLTSCLLAKTSKLAWRSSYVKRRIRIGLYLKRKIDGPNQKSSIKKKEELL